MNKPKFTPEEVKAAKATLHVMADKDTPAELKALYMAGEINMWEECGKDMYEALLAIRRHGLIEQDGYSVIVDMLNNAIAKAEGK